MTTNKPEIRAFLMQQDGCEPYVSIGRDSNCSGVTHPLIRLSDYEALQAECALWKNSASGAHQQLTANRIETEKLAVDWSKAMAECDQLRAAIRRLCNIYVIDDYYMGKQREELLDRAVNRAIEEVRETTQ